MNRIKSDVFAEFMSEKIIVDDKSGINILIKHDYYSSDNDHGKELLANILEFLMNQQTQIGSLFIVDTGVRLFNNEMLHPELAEVISKSSSVYICTESLDEYGITIHEEANMILSDSLLFFEQLVLHKPDIIIE